MGVSITWLGCPEAKADTVLQLLQLVPTGETEEVPESPISMLSLSTGWRIIWFNEYDCRFLRAKEMAVLSQSADLILCLVEEHVMASSAEFWRGGSRRWRLAHEGEDGPVGLTAEGEPPDTYPAIRAQLEKEQADAGGTEAGVDYLFDIPLQVAESVCGFKHDTSSDAPHLVLVRNTPKSGGFFGRHFGG